jgi:LemA protein
MISALFPRSASLPVAPRRSRSRGLLLALPFALALSACGYNSIQSYDEAAAQAKQNIDAQLQRRADLIGNLVATVKGFAQQESEVLTQITQARAGLSGALQRPGGSDPAELANANQQLTNALGRISVVVEAYPQLRSNENFLRCRTSCRARRTASRWHARTTTRRCGSTTSTSGSFPR